MYTSDYTPPLKSVLLTKDVKNYYVEIRLK